MCHFGDVAISLGVSVWGRHADPGDAAGLAAEHRGGARGAGAERCDQGAQIHHHRQSASCRRHRSHDVYVGLGATRTVCTRT